MKYILTLVALMSTIVFAQQINNKITVKELDVTGYINVANTTKGSIPCPKMTTAQINAIVAPIAGQCAFDTSLSIAKFYSGSTWNVSGTTDHLALSNIGTNTHAQIDSHVSSTANPHAVTQAQVGLANVDNTSDLTKNSAVATLTNKTLTSPVINTPSGLVKGDVGLSNVDNTSDATKNSAAATLTNKTLTSPVISTPSGLVKGDVGLNNVDNTSDATKNSAAVTLTNKIIQQIRTAEEIDSSTTGASQTLTSGSSLLRLTNASLTSVEGITAGAINKQLVIINSTGASIDFLNNTGTAANRIITGTGASLSLASDASLILEYSASTTKWQVIGGTGGGAPVNLTGDVTSVGAVTTLTNAPVIAKVLTGFASGAGTVTASDSLLTATQKLDGNTALKLGNTKSFADVSPVVTTQLDVPNNQLTTTATNTRRVETGNANVLKDPALEAATTSWVAYADAAGTAPVDGTDGSPLVTVSNSVTTPLEGLKSLVMVKGATNRQGDGIAIPFTISEAEKTKVLQVSFDYKVFSGTYADNDVSFWIYDVTNAVMIQPAPYLLKNAIGAEKMNLEFQATTSASYRLIAHVASTSAVAYSLQFDNFFAGRQAKNYGSPVTDWISYTPTISGLGSGGSVQNEGFYRRVGDSIEIKGTFRKDATAGTGAATVTFSIPSGLSIDTTKSAAGTISEGQGVAWSFDIDTASQFITSSVRYSSTTTFGFIDDGTVNFMQGSIFRANSYISYNLRIPIQGWSSSTIMSSDASTRVVSFVGNLASNQTLTANVTDLPLTTVKDSHTAWTGSTYVVPVAGDYAVTGWIYSTSSTAGVTIHLNGTRINTFISTSTLGGGGSALLPNLKAGDIISIRADSTITLAGNASSKVSIYKLSGPSQIAASESTNARYTTSAGQSIPTGVDTIVNFGTIVYDSHNAVTTGASWKFTAPASGVYSISSNVLFSTDTFTQNNAVTLSIFKNGSLYGAKANRVQVSGSVSQTATVTDEVKMIAGDYIDIRVAHGEAGNRSMNTSAAQNRVSITIVGN